MRYLLEPTDEFSIINHPAEPALRTLHLLIVPIGLFLWGMIWRGHVWARWRIGVKERRKTGLQLMLLVAPMVISGYALQVTDEPAWRGIWIWTHGLTGAAFGLAYVAHQFGPRLVPRRRAASEQMAREGASSRTG